MLFGAVGQATGAEIVWTDDTIIQPQEAVWLDVTRTLDTLSIGESASLGMHGGVTLRLTGDRLANAGTLVLDGEGESNPAIVAAAGVMRLSGRGQLLLNGAGRLAQLNTEESGLIIQGADHAIRGFGQINAAMMNDGLIEAGDAGKVLTLARANKVNNATLLASDGGILEIKGVAVTQAPTALIKADSALVRLAGTALVRGGTFATANGGVISSGTGGAVLDGVTNTGLFHVDAGAMTIFMGLGFVNDGLILVNPYCAAGLTDLRFAGNVLLSGKGEIRLNNYGVNAQISTTPGATLTQAAGHTIRGRGQILASLINNGTILADAPGDPLALYENDKVNNGEIRATNKGIVEVMNLKLTQGRAGRLAAENGQVILYGGVTIDGGTLWTSGNSEIVGKAGTNTLRNVANQGTYRVFAAATTVVRGSTLVNSGSIEVNHSGVLAPAVLRFDNNLALSGSGRISLNSSGVNAELATARGVTLTQAAGHTIRGSGHITARLINRGLVRADVPGELMQIDSPSFVNHGALSVGEQALVRFSSGAFENEGTTDVAAGAYVDTAINLVNRGAFNVTGGIQGTEFTNRGTFNYAGSWFRIAEFRNEAGTATFRTGQNWRYGANLRVTGGTVNLDVDAGGSVAVWASGGGRVNLNTSQHVAALNVVEGGIVALRPGGERVLHTYGLTIDKATVDLGDNDMIIQSTGADRKALFQRVVHWISDGMDDGNWQGDGLTSSVAAADERQVTGLQALVNDNGSGKPLFSTFAGQRVDTNSILVKYTWLGDMNLSGTVDADDYFILDQAYVGTLQGLRQVDLNADGEVDANDYFLVDSSYIAQGKVLAGGGIRISQGLLSATSVPEPTSVSLVALSSLFLGRRRRR